MTRLEQKIEKLKRQFPGIHGIKPAGEKEAKPAWIHLGDVAEGGQIDELPAADYYGEFRGGYPWINPKLEAAIKAIGYHIEWYDPGTLRAYPDYVFSAKERNQ